MQAENVEIEVTGQLSETEYSAAVARFTKEFGEPKQQRRLALNVTDFDRRDIETRIRITNGHAELMQKIGDWKGDSRNELQADLIEDAQAILKVYSVIRNLLVSDNLQTTVIQFENKIWKTKDFELKLTRQFGKSSVWNFEVELLNHSANIATICKDLRLQPEKEPDAEYWVEFNKKVNLQIDELGEEKLVRLIESYLENNGN